VDREEYLRQAEKEAEKRKNAITASKGEASAVNVANWEKAEGEQKRDRENEAIAAEKELRDRQDEARCNIDDHSEQRGALEAKREKARALLAKPDSGKNGSIENYRTEQAKTQQELKEAQAGLDAIAANKAEQEGKVSGIALNGGSELAALKEKLKISEELSKARSDFEEASKKTVNVKHGKDDDAAAARADSEEARRELQSANDRVMAARDAAERAGVENWQPEDRRGATEKVARIVKERNENIDSAKALELAEALAAAERAYAQARLDAEEQVYGYRLKGYEREKMMLEMENRKLDMAHEQGGMDDARYQRQKAVLAAQGEASKKQADEQREQLQGTLEISRLRRMEAAARDQGALPQAEALRKAAEAKEAGLSLRTAEKEAEGANLTGPQRQQYIQQKMEEDQLAREQERQKQERDRALTREGSKANQAGAVGALKEQLLRMRGDPHAAEVMQEKLARRKDEVGRKEAVQKYIGDGFTGDQAKNRAATDMKTAQAQRLIERLEGGNSKVVADSLTAIGGGGGAFGGDMQKSEDLLKRIAKAIEAVEKQGGVVEEGW